MVVVTDQRFRKHHPICCRSVAISETLNLADPYTTGLISTYELSGKQYPELIERAKDLGNKLSVAWSAQVGRTSFLHVGQRTSFVLSPGKRWRLTWWIVGHSEHDHPLRRIKLHDRHRGD